MTTIEKYEPSIQLRSIPREVWPSSRAKLALLPTRIELLRYKAPVSEGPARIYVKHDDETGILTSGNKSS